MNQNECPLHVEDLQIRQDGMRFSLELRVTNEADAVMEDRVIWVWVVTPDGTIRGREAVPGRGRMAAGTTESVRFTLRTLTPVRSDAIVVAVQRATAGRHQCRRNGGELDHDIQTAVQMWK